MKNLTTNGRLGPWSPWQPCEHSDGDSTGSCMCRSRSCDSPRPRCGGRSCEGARIEVANCSRHVSISVNFWKGAIVVTVHSLSLSFCFCDHDVSQPTECMWGPAWDRSKGILALSCVSDRDLGIRAPQSKLTLTLPILSLSFPQVYVSSDSSGDE